MKRIIYIIGIVILVIIATLFYMNTSSIEESKDIIIDINKLAKDIKEQNMFDDSLEIIEEEVIISNYNFEKEKIQNVVSYIGTGATAEEILILESNDKNNIESLKEKINARLKDRKEAFASYLPNEVYKLENPVLITKDKYIILCICNNAQTMNKYLEKTLKTL